MSAVDAVLDRLRERGFAVRGSAPQWSARCPAHDDRTPSLRVAAGRDGRAVLWCHAGCPTPVVLDALGLSWDALFDQPLVHRAVPTVEKKSEGGSRFDHDNCSVDKGAVRAAAVGLYRIDSRTARCVLPGAEHDQWLHIERDGRRPLRCPTCEWRGGLGEARASVAYGRLVHVDGAGPTGISAFEAAMWLARLDHEAGLLKSRTTAYAVSDDLPPLAATLARSMLQLVGLRNDRWDGEPFTFARAPEGQPRSFASAWSGLTESQIKAGIATLCRHGFLVPAGRHKVGPGRHANLHRLAADELLLTRTRQEAAT